MEWKTLEVNEEEVQEYRKIIAWWVALICGYLHVEDEEDSKTND